MSNILNCFIITDDNMYKGEYNGVKFFLIEGLKDIFLSSAPVIDLKTLKMESENSIITFNVGVNYNSLIKLECKYDSQLLIRKNKLSRILKNI